MTGKIQRAPSWTQTRVSSFPGTTLAESFLRHVRLTWGLAEAPNQYRTWGHLRTTGSPSTLKLVLKCLPRNWQFSGTTEGQRDYSQALCPKPPFDGHIQRSSIPLTKWSISWVHPLTPFVRKVSKLLNRNFRAAIYSPNSNLHFVGKVKSGSHDDKNNH